MELMILLRIHDEAIHKKQICGPLHFLPVLKILSSTELFLLFVTEGSCILLWLCIFQTSTRQSIKKRLLPKGNFQSRKSNYSG